MSTDPADITQLTDEELLAQEAEAMRGMTDEELNGYEQHLQAVMSPEEQAAAQMADVQQTYPEALGFNADGSPIFTEDLESHGEIKNPPTMTQQVLDNVVKPVGEMGGSFAGGVAGGAATGGSPFGIAAGATAGEQLVKQAMNPGRTMEEAGRDSLISGGINAVMPGLGKLASPFAKRSARMIEQAIDPEKRAAQFASKFFQPFSQSVAGRTYAKRLKESGNHILDSGLLQGGTELDRKTGKFIAAHGTKVKPPDAYTLAHNVEEILNGNPMSGKPSLLQDRADFLGKIDQAMVVHNQAGEKLISPINYKTVRASLDPLATLAERYAQTPNTSGGMAGEIKSAIEDVVNDAIKFRGDNGLGEINVSEASDFIGNIYAKLRVLGRYETDQTLTPEAKQAAEEAIGVLEQAANGLRVAQDSKIKEVYKKAGGSIYLRDTTPVEAKNVNDAVHHLLNLRDAGLNPFFDTTGRLMSREEVTRAVSGDNALTSFNRTGLVRKVADSAQDVMYGTNRPSMVQDDLGRKMIDGLNELNALKSGGGQLNNPLRKAVRGMANSPFSKAAGPAVNVIRSNPGTQDNFRPSKREPDNRSMEELVGAHALQYGMEPAAPSGPVLVPRTAAGMNQFASTLIDKAAAAIGDPATVDKLRQTFQHGTDEERRQSIALLLKHVPQIAESFEPSASGLLSEIDGKIYAEDDIVAAAEALEDSDMSERDKAKAWNILWNERRYTGKPLVTRAAMPGFQPRQ